MVFCAAISATLCIIQSFSNSYLMFMVFEFLSSIVSSGIYTVTFILGMYLNRQKLKFQKHVANQWWHTMWYCHTLYIINLYHTYFKTSGMCSFAAYYNSLNVCEYTWIYIICDVWTKMDCLFFVFYIAMELFLPHQRVLYYSILECFLPVGSILTAYIASIVQDWRLLLRIVNIPGLLFLSYFWLLSLSTI